MLSRSELVGPHIIMTILTLISLILFFTSVMINRDIVVVTPRIIFLTTIIIDNCKPKEQMKNQLIERLKIFHFLHETCCYNEEGGHF